jgi:hypothetical protein
MKRYARVIIAAVAAALVWRTLRSRWPTDSVHPITDTGDEGTTSPEIRRALQLMYTPGQAAESQLEHHLTEMRERPEASVEDLRSTYRSTPDDDFSLRWSLVYLAGQLAVNECVGFLAEILDADIPPERSIAIHDFSTVSEESKIRYAALDGLERLAAEGSELARQALASAVNHPVASVRALAIVAVNSVDPQSRARLDDEVPEADRWMLALRRTTVTDVPQVLDPAGQIHPSITRIPIRPAPELDSEIPVTTPQRPWRRPPTVGRPHP